jgi:hypothetical protein
VLCDPSCVSALESKEMVTTPSGLQYKDIVAGTGPQAVTGYQVRSSNSTYAVMLCTQRHAVAFWTAVTPLGQHICVLEKG